MGPHFLFRMKRWSQRPPSPRRMILFVAVVAICILIAALEHFGLWPEVLTSERGIRRPPRVGF